MIKNIFKSKVFQNFSFLTIGSLLSQIVGLIIVLKISRVFLPTEYGFYTFIFAQSQLISTIGDLGMKNIIIRAISRNYSRTKDLIFNGIKLRIIATIILLFIYLIYNNLLGTLNGKEILILFLFALSGIIGNLFENAFIGQQKMFIPAVYNLAFSILMAFIIFILPISYYRVDILLAIQIVFSIIKSGILYVIMLKKKVLVGEVQNFFISVKQLLGESWPYFVLILVMLPTISFSNNFLDINSTKTEIAYFNLSQKLIGPITLVIGFALSSIFPNLSAMWINDKKRFEYITTNGTNFFILFALCLCFIFTIFSREIVLVLFTVKYQAAIEVCQLQIWYVLLMSINSLIGTIWGAVNKEKLILKTGIINALISTPLLYLGSKYGALGISYAYVVSFALFEIYLWIEFKKTMKTNLTNDFKIWGLVLISFLLSNYLLNNVNFYIRMIIAILYIFAFGIYLFRKYINDFSKLL